MGVRLDDSLVEHYGYFVGGEALGWVAGAAGAYRGFVVLACGDFLLQNRRQTTQIASFPTHDETGRRAAGRAVLHFTGLTGVLSQARRLQAPLLQ